MDSIQDYIIEHVSGYTDDDQMSILDCIDCGKSSVVLPEPSQLTADMVRTLCFNDISELSKYGAHLSGSTIEFSNGTKAELESGWANSPKLYVAKGQIVEGKVGGKKILKHGGDHGKKDKKRLFKIITESDGLFKPNELRDKYQAYLKSNSNANSKLLNELYYQYCVHASLFVAIVYDLLDYRDVLTILGSPEDSNYVKQSEFGQQSQQLKNLSFKSGSQKEVGIVESDLKQALNGVVLSGSGGQLQSDQLIAIGYKYALGKALMSKRDSNKDYDIMSKLLFEKLDKGTVCKSDLTIIYKSIADALSNTLL